MTSALVVMEVCMFESLANCSFFMFIQGVDKKLYRQKAGNSIGKHSIVAQVILSFVYGLEKSFIFLAGS